MTPIDTFTTDIIFRYDTSKDFKGTIFAVMPHDAERNGNVTTYQHVGQHSTGDYNHMIATSRPANEFESAEYRGRLGDAQEPVAKHVADRGLRRALCRCHVPHDRRTAGQRQRHQCATDRRHRAQSGQLRPSSGDFRRSIGRLV